MLITLFKKIFLNSVLKTVTYTYGVMEKPDYLCFYSTNLDSNITALYDYIRKNKLDQKYGLRLFFVTTETRKFLYKNFDKNKIIVVNTARGIMSLLKCKVLFATNTLFGRYRPCIKNKNSLFIQLWHGLPIKRRPKNYSFTRDDFKEFDLFISTSTYTSYLLASYLDVSVQNFRVTGYPRNDKLLNTDSYLKARSLLNKLFNIGEEYKKTKYILYAPTFRRYNYIKHIDLLNLSWFNKIINSNYVLFIKFHIYDENKYKEMIEKLRIKMSKHYKNIFIITNGLLIDHSVDIYDLLAGFDILITDYSSIFNDYILLNKPIIFYMPDLDYYYKFEGLIYPKNSLKYILPGPIITNNNSTKELYYNIEYDTYKLERIRYQKLIHEFVDNKSSERVWNIVKEFLHHLDPD